MLGSGSPKSYNTPRTLFQCISFKFINFLQKVLRRKEREERIFLCNELRPTLFAIDDAEGGNNLISSSLGSFGCRQNRAGSCTNVIDYDNTGAGFAVPALNVTLRSMPLRFLAYDERGKG